MNRTEYIKALSHKLRRLPKEDYDRAIEYFEEYFDEAGAENEQQAIQDLGSPDDAARELLMDLAGQNITEPPKTVKRGISSIWIGILGVCAAPIALPIAFTAIILLFCAVLTIFLVLFGIVLGAVVLAAAGVIGVIGGGLLTFKTFADGICNLGIGIFFVGLGTLATYGSILLSKWTIRKTAVLLGKIAKGGHKNDKEK